MDTLKKNLSNSFKGDATPRTCDTPKSKVRKLSSRDDINEQTPLTPREQPEKKVRKISNDDVKQELRTTEFSDLQNVDVNPKESQTSTKSTNNVNEKESL